MGMTDTAPVRLSPGDQAPDFTLPDADGKPVSLSGHRGRRVIVYCYPAALTPGCTTQAVDFTASAGDLAEAGLDIIGISPDEPEKLLRFREKEQLGITLVSDPEKKVLQAYGAYGPKKLYGKEVVGVIRSTFIVDADGRIEQASYNVKATGVVTSPTGRTAPSSAWASGRRAGPGPSERRSPGPRARREPRAVPSGTGHARQVPGRGWQAGGQG
jgi:peroxiredoxin Q/BCP